MEFDVAIIGGGPGGRCCAQAAGKEGLQVALIEKDYWGGTSLNKGYFPLKSLLHLAETQPHADVAQWIFQCRRRIQEGKRIWHKRLKECRVQLFQGCGHIESPHTIRVMGWEKETIIHTKNLIIATGTEPISPFLEPFDEVRGLIHYQGALSQKGLSAKEVIIIGGDVEGGEFATLFHQQGAVVTILEMKDRILPNSDQEIAHYLEEEWRKKGVQIFTGSNVEHVSFLKNRKVQITYKHRGDQHSIQGEMVLVTGHYRPLLPPGIELLSLRHLEGGFIEVNQRMETSKKGVYAIGDVIGGVASANAAIQEGKTAARALIGEEAPIDYSGLSYVFFTSPMITGVGLTEDALKEKDLPYRVYKSFFADNLRAASLDSKKGFIKLLVHDKKETLLGVHILGEDVAELNHLSSLMIRKNISIEELKDLPLAHPTRGEIFKEALESSCSAVSISGEKNL